jgi:hypothetical protein
MSMKTITKIKIKTKNKRSRYNFLRKVVKSRKVVKKVSFVFGNSVAENRRSVIRVYKLECGHTVKLRERSGKRGIRKFVLCVWCETGEERQ